MIKLLLLLPQMIMIMKHIILMMVSSFYITHGIVQNLNIVKIWPWKYRDFYTTVAYCKKHRNTFFAFTCQWK